MGDEFVATAALIVIGAVFGFFIWNFPAGLIFLGDGGAYVLGFLLGELSVLLLMRNPQVSPMFCLLLCAYPIFETVFSIYRKKFLRGGSAGMPDGVHLHMLVYKRLMRWAVGPEERRQDGAQLDDVALSLAALPDVGPAGASSGGTTPRSSPSSCSSSWVSTCSCTGASCASRRRGGWCSGADCAPWPGRVERLSGGRRIGAVGSCHPLEFPPPCRTEPTLNVPYR